ncbi:hypothetical protein M8494_30900 [Serratia ureilytica]
MIQTVAGDVARRFDDFAAQADFAVALSFAVALALPMLSAISNAPRQWMVMLASPVEIGSLPEPASLAWDARAGIPNEAY